VGVISPSLGFSPAGLVFASGITPTQPSPIKGEGFTAECNLTMPPAPLQLQRRAEELASLLPPLLVAAQRVAAHVAPGVHGRRRVGPGETFWQFRRYQPGDPVTAIDWRKSAKSDPVFVRETEWTAAQAVWLWHDRSPSMEYRSAPHLPTKRDRAALLVLALAVLLERGGEAIGLLGDARGPSQGRAVLTRLATTLSEPTIGDNLPPPTPLPRHAQIVLAGDFLAPLDEVDTLVRRLAERGAAGHMVQILDPAEEALPFEGRVRFAGLEGEGETLITRTEDVREAYIGRLAAHRDGLAAIARSVGWRFAVHHTDQPPQTILLTLHGALGTR